MALSPAEPATLALSRIIGELEDVQDAAAGGTIVERGLAIAAATREICSDGEKAEDNPKSPRRCRFG